MYFRACAIVTGSAVKCWGINANGELGDGTIRLRSVPSIISSVANSISVAAGQSHSCAVISGGAVKCWGLNSVGQLGQGNLNSSSTPVSVTGIANATMVAVSRTYSCALFISGKIKCWGANDSGELGYEDQNYRGGNPGDMANLDYVNLGVGRTAKSIALGNRHTCVILDNDQVKCWGWNGYGQLGYGDTTDRGANVGDMAALLYVNLGLGHTAKSIHAGREHMCVILDNNQVKCWGNNDSGQLGYEDTANRGHTTGSMASLQYVNLGMGRTAKSMALGDNFTCAILDNNKVKCWGDNYHGQLGNGDASNRGNNSNIPLDQYPYNLYQAQ